MLSYRHKVYILSVVLFIGLSALYFLGLKYAFTILSRKADEVFQKRSELEILGLKKMAKNILIKNLNDTEIDRAYLNKFFIEEKDIVEFLEVIEKIAGDYGIKYYEINPLQKDKNNKRAFLINIYSSFPNFMKFLTVIENFDYFVKVKSVNISKIEKDINIQKFPLLSEGDINATIIIEVGV